MKKTEYQNWQKNPEEQKEYLRWRIEQDLKELQQLTPTSPTLLNQFKQIFGEKNESHR